MWQNFDHVEGARNLTKQFPLPFSLLSTKIVLAFGVKIFRVTLRVFQHFLSLPQLMSLTSERWISIF